ncbi:LOW QUALITY PROTEIN: ETS domain-containing protein Elk-1-like [Acropora millepora]|uniref:LOW QUALITY PROTEIN: ETS domain-containing protein Elk-1-like n=1 Tax=Acropora millepora TaxID=45264 RepID=UPI001CF4CE1A|nr:LOW QUALITY PROTEIN: ETS domain-containing protein Elk-1-like [Acropora millepora]
MEEIVEASKPCSEEVCSKRRAYRSQPRYKNIVHLWEFLLELLAKESCSSLITWVRKERGEFQLKNPEEVARRWGLVKGKVGMNYAKLSRALRYYYQQEIIKKVPGQRLVYKFNKLPYKYKLGMRESLYNPEKFSNKFDECSVTDNKPAPRNTLAIPATCSAFTPTHPSLGRRYSVPFRPMPPCSFLWYPRYSFSRPQGNSSKRRIVYGSSLSMTSFPLQTKAVPPVYPVYVRCNKFLPKSIPVSVIVERANESMYSEPRFSSEDFNLAIQ